MPVFRNVCRFLCLRVYAGILGGLGHFGISLYVYEMHSCILRDCVRVFVFMSVSPRGIRINPTWVYFRSISKSV